MSAFLKQLGAVKVKEVPDFFRKTVTYENFLTHGEKFAMEYKASRGRAGEEGGGVRGAKGFRCPSRERAEATGFFSPSLSFALILGEPAPACVTCARLSPRPFGCGSGAPRGRGWGQPSAHEYSTPSNLIFLQKLA